MIRTITGGKYAGSLIKKADANVKLILGSLALMNSPETQAKLKGLKNLAPFVVKKEGLNGMVEQFKSLHIFATEDSAYSDAPTYDETFDQWFYTRKG